jgi:ATP-dependent Clp protease ATP-binding subunit ClpA
MVENRIVLDPTLSSRKVQDFEAALRRKVVGQERAIRQLARIYQVFQAGLSTPGRPIASLLYLGPTGCGKTRLVEAAAEALFGDARAVVKIDCAELQHSHEISKLIGSPPGYIGHRETPAALTQEALNRHHTENIKLTLVLFDEIEKASDALWQLLLGVLDKASLTLGDNRRVDFSRCMIFLTSNLGSPEMMKLMEGGMGFTSNSPHDVEELDRKIDRAATEAARRKFSPEFMNRLDKVMVFRALKPQQLDEILDIELERVQQRIMKATLGGHQFVFRCEAPARDFLLREGTDAKSGARHLQRSIERHLVFPLSNLIATQQIRFGDQVTVDFDDHAGELVFAKEDPYTMAGPTLTSEEESYSAPLSTRAAAAWHPLRLGNVATMTSRPPDR